MRKTFVRHTLLTVALVGLIFLLWRSGVLQSDNPILWAVVVVVPLCAFNVAAAVWVYYDCKRRGIPKPGVKAGLVFFWSIAGLEDYLDKRQEIAANSTGH